MGQDASNSVATQLLLGGTAAVPAVVVTHPLDVIKLRLQLQSNGAEFHYRGTFSGLAQIAREEGLTQLFKGMSPAIARAYTFSAARLGLYEPFRSAVSSKDGPPTFYNKLGAGLASGIVGSLLVILVLFLTYKCRIV